MLRKYSNRIRAYFAVDYEPRLGGSVAQAAEKVQTEFSPSRTNVGMPLAYTFDWPHERYFITLNATRIAWQSLELTEWYDNYKKHVKVFRAALDAIGVDEFKRVGFKVSAYLPLQMSHQELCHLMFGSFLESAESFDEMLGGPLDPLVLFEGERKGWKYTLHMSAMNAQQIATSFRQDKNLERFLEDRFLDTGVKDFQNRITASDCLFFDVDLFKNDVAVTELDDLVKDSLSESERMADACVRRLRSKPTLGGK